MAHRWSSEDQRIIDGSKKIAGGTKTAGTRAFYKFAVPKNPKLFLGKQLAKGRPRESKKSFWNRKISLKKIS